MTIHRCGKRFFGGGLSPGLPHVLWICPQCPIRIASLRLPLPPRPPIRPLARLPTHPFAHSPVCPLTHLPTRPFAHSPGCPLAHLPTCLFAHLPVCPLARLPTHPFAHTTTAPLRLRQHQPRVSSPHHVWTAPPSQACVYALCTYFSLSCIYNK